MTIAVRGARDPPSEDKLASLLERLLPIFADASVGIFEKDVAIPEGEDELTPVYVGVQVMLEVLRDQLKELEATVARTSAELDRAVVARPMVRRIVRELMARADVQPATMKTVGEGLAAGAGEMTLEARLALFAEMGLGTIEIVAQKDGRYTFRGRDLLERADRSRTPTCHLAVGFVTRSVALAQKGAAAGCELACQSRGDLECRFAVEARA